MPNGSENSEDNINNGLTKASYTLNTLNLAYSTKTLNKLQINNYTFYMASSLGRKIEPASLSWAAKDIIAPGRIYTTNVLLKLICGKVLDETISAIDAISLGKEIFDPFSRLPKGATSQDVDRACQDVLISEMNFGIDLIKWDAFGIVFAASPPLGISLIVLDHAKMDAKIKYFTRPLLQQFTQKIYPALYRFCELEAQAEAPLSPTMNCDGYPLYEVKQKSEKINSCPIPSKTEINNLPVQAKPVQIPISQKPVVTTSKPVSTKISSEGVYTINTQISVFQEKFSTNQQVGLSYLDQIIKDINFNSTTSIKTIEVFNNYFEKLNQLPLERSLRVCREIMPVREQSSYNWNVSIGVTATGAPIIGLTVGASLSSAAVLGTMGVAVGVTAIGYAGYKISENCYRWSHHDVNALHHLVNMRVNWKDWNRNWAMENAKKAMLDHQKKLRDPSLSQKQIKEEMDAFNSNKAIYETAKENDAEFQKTGIVCGFEKRIQKVEKEIEAALQSNNLIKAKEIAIAFQTEFPYSEEPLIALANIESKLNNSSGVDQYMDARTSLLRKYGNNISDDDVCKSKISILQANNCTQEVKTRLDAAIQKFPHDSDLRKHRIFLKQEDTLSATLVEDIKFRIEKKDPLTQDEKIFYASVLNANKLEDSATRLFIDGLIRENIHVDDLKKYRIYLEKGNLSSPTLATDVSSITKAPLNFEDKLRYASILSNNKVNNAQACALVGECLNENPDNLQGHLLMIKLSQQNGELAVVKKHAVLSLELAKAEKDDITVANLQTILISLSTDQKSSDKMNEDFLETIARLDPTVAEEYAEKKLIAEQQLIERDHCDARKIINTAGGILYYGGIFMLARKIATDKSDPTKAPVNPLTPQTEEEIRSKMEVNRNFQYKFRR